LRACEQDTTFDAEHAEIAEDALFFVSGLCALCVERDL
jgi:hypothetical protein